MSFETEFASLGAVEPSSLSKSDPAATAVYESLKFLRLRSNCINSYLLPKALLSTLFIV
jgi:hypothetical protein